MEGFEESEPTGNKCKTTTPQHKAYFSSPSVPTVLSPLPQGISPTHGKHLTTHAAHSSKPATPYAGATYMVEYVRKEHHSAPLPVDSHLFPEGLEPGDVVEVWGNIDCGKSALILSIVASALLPRVWCGIELGGCSTGVTLIDCDQHFSIFQLVNLMYKRVKSKLKLAKNALSNHSQNMTIDKLLIHSSKEVTELLRSNKTNLKTKIEEMVHNCLKSLYYIKCLRSEQFPLVLASMEEHLAKHSDVSLVVVESLSAFCGYDRFYRGAGKLYKMREYYDRVLSVLLANARKYKVVLLTVKHALFENFHPRMYQVQKQKEKSYQNQRGKRQGGKNDIPTVKSNYMKNMALFEYFGYGWVSSVTWSVILSKARVSPMTPLGVIAKRARRNDSSNNSVMRSKHKEVVFSAKVVKAKQKRSLFFVIDEEGVIWR